MKDSELRMIETMLKKQDELNSAIMKEFGLTTISKEQIDLATLDEIGEFTHELKGDYGTNVHTVKRFKCLKTRM